MTRHDEDPSLEGLGDESAGARAGRHAAVFAWTAVKATLISLLVGVTLVFSAVLGVTIYRTYFAIPEEVEVPAIEAKEIRDANEILAQLGLKLKIGESRHSTKVPERVVISQDPAPGRKVRQGREVTAVVSLGPDEIAVPDLSGKSLREVKIALSNAQLNLGKVTWSDKLPDSPEEVLNQKPKAGDRVRRGAKVDVQVNKGSGVATVAVPNWKGQSLAEVEEKVRKADLEMGGVVWLANETVPRGQIIGQAPPQGSEVTPGSSVDFEVSSGPPSDRVYKQRTLHVEVPEGSDVQSVKIVVISDVGETVAYRGTHLAGDVMDLVVTGSPGSEVEIYVNTRLQSREKL